MLGKFQTIDNLHETCVRTETHKNSEPGVDFRKLYIDQ